MLAGTDEASALQFPEITETPFRKITPLLHGNLE
jgi:hypothetical protein